MQRKRWCWVVFKNTDLDGFEFQGIHHDPQEAFTHCRNGEGIMPLMMDTRLIEEPYEMYAFFPHDGGIGMWSKELYTQFYTCLNEHPVYYTADPIAVWRNVFDLAGIPHSIMYDAFPALSTSSKNES